MRHRLGFLTGLLALAFLGAAVQASLAVAASPGWVDAETLSSSVRAERLQTAIDADGDVLAVWDSNGIMISTRSPGDGGWSAPQQISTETQIGAPALAVNAAGEAVIVWLGLDGTSAIHTITRDAAGSFSAETTISLPSESPGSPRVAIDSSGDAVVSWTAQGASPAVRVATRPARGEFRLAGTIPVSGEFGLETAPAIVGEGEVILTWTERNGPAVIVKMARGSIGAATFSSAVELSAPDSEAFELEIAADEDGDAVVVWSLNENGNSAVQATARSGRAGDFGTPVQISPGNGQESSPHIAMAANGEATIVWSTQFPEQAVESASWSPARGYSEVQQLSATGAEGTTPAVASNASGDTLVSWHAGSGASGSIQAAAKPAGAAEFGPPVTISTPGRVQPPAVAIAPDGNGVSAWTYILPAVGSAGAKSPHTNSVPADGVVQAAGFDATPPLLTDVVIPATGMVGQPLSFSAKAIDVWTRGPATEFAFGDGGSASGTAASHAYGAPGTYSVKVTATDARGFTATEHGSIKIDAAATDTEKSKDKLTTTANAKAKVAIALKAPQTLPISAGAVVLKIQNKGNRAVSGTLNLWTTAHLKVEVPASVGAQDYKVKPGKTVTVTVALSAEALQLVNRKASHRLAVKAAASYKDASGKGGKVSRKIKLEG
jgi:hypothetical protein